MDLPVLAGIIPEGAIVTAVGLRLSPDCSEAQYASILGCLCDAMEFGYDYLPIYLGDAIQQGERIWGDTYAQYVQVTGRRVELLRDYVWVARAVPEGIRHPSLRYGHYKAVAGVRGEGDSLRLRAAWLRRAAEEGWTVDELRQLVKASVEPPEDGVMPPERLSLRQVLRTALDYARQGEWAEVLRILEEAVER